MMLNRLFKRYGAPSTRYVSAVSRSSQAVPGFTIVETLVAISILTLSIIGPFYVIQSALNSSFAARDQLVAVSLAQEAIEYVRAVRDNNYLAGRSWMDDLSTLSCYGASPSGYCTVDPTQGDVHQSENAIETYGQTSSVPVLYVSATNLYNQQNSGTASRFKRYVQIHSISATEVKITATVTWATAQIPYTATVEGYLMNWL